MRASLSSGPDRLRALRRCRQVIASLDRQGPMPPAQAHPAGPHCPALEAATPGLRRTMVMTAVIMGFPVQG